MRESAVYTIEAYYPNTMGMGKAKVKFAIHEGGWRDARDAFDPTAVDWTEVRAASVRAAVVASREWVRGVREHFRQRGG